MKYFLVSAIICLSVTTSCKTNMPGWEAGDPASSKRILIASEKTSYKEKLLNRLTEKLKNEDYYIKITGIDILNTPEPDKYKVILIVTWCSQKKLYDKRVNEFLDKNPQNPKVIVFYTHGGADPYPEDLKPEINADAVTSASNAGRIEKTSDEIISSIKKKFL